jgi:hypothetical protein
MAEAVSRLGSPILLSNLLTTKCFLDIRVGYADGTLSIGNPIGIPLSGQVIPHSAES